MGTIIRKSLGIHLFFICKQISPMNINLKASVSSLSLFCLFLRKAQNTLSLFHMAAINVYKASIEKSSYLQLLLPYAGEPIVRVTFIDINPCHAFL